jgi:hypothetical protein
MAQLLAATVLVLPVATAVAPARPAQAAAGLAGACPDADGVTVVVDFQELGGQTLVRCAPGPQPTGLAALKNAGFSVTGTNRWGEAFICRINGKPGPDTEPCIDTPPASAYWSYWHAPNGGSWTYSQLGVTSRRPPPGSFEGWSFALDATGIGPPVPGVAPRRAAPPAGPSPPDPPPGGSPPAGDPPPADPGTGEGQRERAGAPGTGGDPPAPRTSSPADTPTGPVAAPATDPATDPATATAGGRTGRPAPKPPDVDSVARSGAGGEPVGALVGVGLLLALVVAAIVTVRRRQASS